MLKAFCATFCSLLYQSRPWFLIISRDGRALVLKKVRRLRPDGSDTDSCPIFDGVQVLWTRAWQCLCLFLKISYLHYDVCLQIYADPDSCNRFYKCENGTMSLETCENGLLFDQVCHHLIICCPDPDTLWPGDGPDWRHPQLLRVQLACGVRREEARQHTRVQSRQVKRRESQRIS